MEQLVTDWRFLLAAAAIISAIAETRLKVKRHERLLDKKWITDQATMIANVETTTDDMAELKNDFKKFLEKYDEGQQRLWTSHEKLNERVARIEGSR